MIGQRVAGGRPPRSYWSNLHKIASRSAQICVPIRTKLRPNLHKFASRSAQNCVPICTKLRPDLHKIASQSAQICRDCYLRWGQRSPLGPEGPSQPSAGARRRVAVGHPNLLVYVNARISASSWYLILTPLEGYEVSFGPQT